MVGGGLPSARVCQGWAMGVGTAYVHVRVSRQTPQPPPSFTTGNTTHVYPRVKGAAEAWSQAQGMGVPRGPGGGLRTGWKL